MPSPESRLFHAVVVMGCALAQLSGCAEAPAGPCDPSVATCPNDPDGGADPSHDADGGWPPTK